MTLTYPFYLNMNIEKFCPFCNSELEIMYLDSRDEIYNSNCEHRYVTAISKINNEIECQNFILFNKIQIYLNHKTLKVSKPYLDIFDLRSGKYIIRIINDLFIPITSENKDIVINKIKTLISLL